MTTTLSTISVWCLMEITAEADERALCDERISAVLRVMDTPAPNDTQTCMFVITLTITILSNMEDIPIHTFFPVTNSIIDKYVKEGKHILVHCASGMSRSPTIVASYLMHIGAFTRNEVIWHLRSKRPVLEINRGFRKQLDVLVEI